MAKCVTASIRMLGRDSIEHVAEFAQPVRGPLIAGRFRFPFQLAHLVGEYNPEPLNLYLFLR